MSEHNPLGDFIRRKRGELSLSQRELAARCGVSHGYIANLERGYDHATGKPTNPSVEKLARLAEGMKIPCDRLLRLAQGELQTLDKDTVLLPVYGFASCGSPAYIEGYPEEFQSWPSFVSHKADGILLVRGDSMEGVGFLAGDHLFVRRLDGESPRSGSKVIASIDGDFTCKIYRKDELGEYLEAAYLGDRTWRVPLLPEISLVALVIGTYRREP